MLSLSLHQKIPISVVNRVVSASVQLRSGGVVLSTYNLSI